jgi:outer membrane protein
MSLICLGTALLHPVLCISQSKEAPSAPATRLDVARSIELALQNNNRSGISQDSVEMAVALHRQALSSWWPQISGSVLASRMDEDQMSYFLMTRLG